jgi:hypothetical protein
MRGTDRDGVRKDARRSRGFCWSLAVVVACLAWPASGAWAVTVPAGFLLDIQVVGGASTWNADESSLSSQLSLTPSGTETTLALTGPQTVLGGNAIIQSWDSTFDPDPFVTNNFVVVNNSAVTQTFTVSVSSPVMPAFLTSSLVQSNVILTINDDDGVGGAQVDSSGTSVYEAFVNGSSALTFLDDPFSNSCTSPFDCTFNGTSADAITSQAFGPVSATSIGITITFDLSPGDSATVQSRFEIVPEPAALGLLALGLVATALARRRGSR